MMINKQSVWALWSLITSTMPHWCLLNGGSKEVHNDILVMLFLPYLFRTFSHDQWTIIWPGLQRISHVLFLTYSCSVTEADSLATQMYKSSGWNRDMTPKMFGCVFHNDSWIDLAKCNTAVRFVAHFWGWNMLMRSPECLQRCHKLGSSHG